MPYWLPIPLEIGCWFSALWQVRMSFIYTGRIHSPTIGPVNAPTLRAMALLSAVQFAIYGFLVLLIPWPRLLTYASIVWLCRAIIAGLLGWVGRGVHGSTPAMLTQKGRRYYVILEFVGVLIRAVVFAACAFFFGF